MAYVNRNENKEIIAIFSKKNKQAIDQEWVDDDNEEIIYFGKPTLKQQERDKHTQNHLNYQNTVFNISVKRDDIAKQDIVLVLNCTDDTRKNIESSLKVAEARNSVYFYDGLGTGDYFSLTEIKQISDQFLDRVDPSFVIKGKGKKSINDCSDNTMLITLSDKFNGYFKELLSELNNGKNPAEIKVYLDSLEF